MTFSPAAEVVVIRSSHLDRIREPLWDYPTGVKSNPMAELDVFEMTRLLLRGEDVPGGFGWRADSTASNLDIADCILQLTKRLVAEADRTDETGADERQMWEPVLSLGKETLGKIPLSLGRFILHLCWADLSILRRLNHKHRRCSCFTDVLDSETPICRSTNEADPPFRFDAGREADLVDPLFMDGNYIRKESHAIVAGGQQSPCKRPVCPSVTTEEIWDCVVSALHHAIVEISDDERLECIAIWQAMLDESTDTIHLQPPSVLAVVLAGAWGDVVSVRAWNHETGRCSHYGPAAKIDGATPPCGVGEELSDSDSNLDQETRDP